MEGFNADADDYIMKPFNSSVLKARVNSLLNNRAILQDFFRKRYLLEDKSNNEIIKKHEPANTTFIEKVKELINESMHQEAYSVGHLSEDLNMSRTHLNRKFKSLLGIPPSEFIKLCRLQKAMHLLKTENNPTVAEVAYAVGFKEASNFSRAFKSHYGISPSDVTSY